MDLDDKKVAVTNRGTVRGRPSYTTGMPDGERMYVYEVLTYARDS